MIYVIGATNVDCLVNIQGKSRMYESNICNIDFKLGGVGCNMARSASNFNKVEFVTVLNDFALTVGKVQLNRENLSIKQSLISSSNEKCMYIDVIDKEGLVIGASDMSLFDNADLSFMDKTLKSITDDDYVILDANSRRLVEYVLSKAKGKKFIDAVSSVKLERIKDLLDKIYLVKVNNFEYEFIKDVRKDNMLITNGKGGTLLLDGKKVEFFHNTLAPINPTGCGDSFFGAFVSNLDKGIETALTKGIISAVACSQIEESVPFIKDIEDTDLDSLNIKIK